MTIAVVLFILWMALRWWRIIFAVFVSLVVGLSITAAVGLLLVGTLNLISVYFAVLFVGLGSTSAYNTASAIAPSDTKSTICGALIHAGGARARR